MKVAKFGGSSVRDAQAMGRCMSIIENDPSIKLVVVSATYNSTNELEKLAIAARDRDEAFLKENLKLFLQKHLDIASNLKIEKSLHSAIDQLINELSEELKQISQLGLLSPQAMDSLYSYGERISSWLFAEGFKSRGRKDLQLIDARDVITTDNTHNSAKPIIEQIRINAQEKISPLIKTHLIITQGFIGKTEQGATTVLGREGSDFSATLFGEAIGADVVQIWTDVPGVATADPRLVKEARYLSELSYEEATTMASLGAKVLYSKTLEPAERSGIKVFVGSSIQPELGGTYITSTPSSDSADIIGLTFKKRGDESVITFIGKDLRKIDLEIPEVDRGDIHRSFLVDTSQLDQLLIDWHQRFFQK
ncbi:MAG: hypothetical protein CO099_12090 [Bdellovibrio sp. CG_4_9_14_3_um_filter_39_7]|nr:MAG: hypothetical protein CO099_12090 [Bdellovibrio sp. CG_4_9_14_3_um_filter_39_7]